jgi:hypothetical protein
VAQQGEKPPSPGAGGQADSRLRIPGFVNDNDIGLGDVVKRATQTVGIAPCGRCGERARRLNHWLTFTGRRRTGSGPS